jgi:DNA-binding transcriptional LysR family regulator
VQFRQLEYLVALARENHFARAAAACWVSQPTLSDGIRSLEAELGVAVVLRGHRYEGLTPEGERLLGFAQRVLHDRDQLLNEIGTPGEGLHGRIRLGAIPTSMPPLPLLTTPFRERNPGIELTVLSLSASEIERRLKTFELDAGLSYLENHPTEHFSTLPLYSERHLLLVSDEVIAVDRREISWGDAAELPLCLLTRDMQNRRIVDGLFASAGAHPSPKIETDSISALLSHVRWGRCASIVPQSWLRSLGTPHGTHVLRFSDGDSASQIGLIWLDNDPEPLLTTALVEVARSLDLQSFVDSELAAPDEEGIEAPR